MVIILSIHQNTKGELKINSLSAEELLNEKTVKEEN